MFGAELPLRHHRLLILGCSAKKRHDAAPMPAIERYDGPAFKIVRKYLSECPTAAADIDIWILSGKYGLIHAITPIEDYDEYLTQARVAELKIPVAATLAGLPTTYREICINLGRNYLPLLAIIPPRAVIIEGMIGKRLRRLKRWLYVTAD